MKELIKQILNESKDEQDKNFIFNFNKKKVLVQKITPKIVNFLRNNLDEYYLYDISEDVIRIAYGSTSYYNDLTGEREPFSSDIPRITLRFIDLSPVQKSEVRKKVYDYINDIFGVDLRLYGSPLDVKFINLLEFEF
jgi:hypothetical protein